MSVATTNCGDLRRNSSRFYHDSRTDPETDHPWPQEAFLLLAHSIDRFGFVWAVEVVASEESVVRESASSTESSQHEIRLHLRDRCGHRCRRSTGVRRPEGPLSNSKD